MKLSLIALEAQNICICCVLEVGLATTAPESAAGSKAAIEAGHCCLFTPVELLYMGEE